jgi:excisionase family DNA binding protein
MAIDLSDYVSRSEAARVLRCSSELVSALAHAGKLPSLATPNGRIFHRRDVERLAAERARRPGPGSSA